MNEAACRILLVGAGGIGCEVLKTLVLSKFRKIHIVDLDTIDETNLSRQLLFRFKDVGRAKCTVAADAMNALASRLDGCAVTSVTAARRNIITDPEVLRDLSEHYDVVVSALDNIAARRALNAAAVKDGLPLVEAGTTGDLGQCTPMLPGGLTRCFDCEPHPEPVVFPVCTIRQRPEKPEHCVAWAKHVYDGLFGPRDTTNDVHLDVAAVATDARALLTKLHGSDISTLRDTWSEAQHGPPPLPLDIDALMASAPATLGPAESANAAALLDSWHLSPWSAAEAAQVAVRSLAALREGAPPSWTKEDPRAVDLVAALSNLRMRNFHIEPLSRWRVESIAGAIVPAVAAVNAVVGGLQVVQVLNWVRALANASGDRTAAAATARMACVDSFLATGGPQRLTSVEPAQKNPQCWTCGAGAQQRSVVRLGNFAHWTAGEVVQDVVARALGYSETFVAVFSHRGYLFEKGEEEVDVEPGTPLCDIFDDGGTATLTVVVGPEEEKELVELVPMASGSRELQVVRNARKVLERPAKRARR